MIQFSVGPWGENVDRPSPTSGFVAACLGLTELTLICIPWLDAQIAAKKALLDPSGRARSVISELVTACKTLPYFETLQIVYYPVFPRSQICWCGKLWCYRHPPSVAQDQALREYMKAVKGWSMECLERPNTRCQEVDERKEIKLRKYMKVVKGWAIDGSKRPELGRKRPESERKRATLRVIEMTREPLRPMFYQRSAKVEEYEM